MLDFLYLALVIFAAVFTLAVLLTLMPHLGRIGRAISEASTRPPLLDVVLFALTAGPWIFAFTRARWLGLAGAVVGQMGAVYAWICFHELLNLRAACGPRIIHFTNRLVGRFHNHLALWLTTFGVPVLWAVRLLEIFVYPTLVWLLRFPRYNHADWVTLSRHKFRDLVGHDLVWCLYCDWMTGTWSLGTEMLRNVESFWCPIRFSIPKKLENCRTDFPDIDGGWVPADSSMSQVVKVLEEKYTPENQRSWFGHPSRLPRANGADHRTTLPLPSDMDDLHRELLLEHSRHPHNHRPLPTATHQAAGELPFCNDRLTIFVQLADGHIADVTFQGTACPICTASASMMTDCIRNLSPADAQRLFHCFHDLMTRPTDSLPTDTDLGPLVSLSGIQRYPSRIKCATLPWHTLMAALANPACAPQS